MKTEDNWGLCCKKGAPYLDKRKELETEELEKKIKQFYRENFRTSKVIGRCRDYPKHIGACKISQHLKIPYKNRGAGCQTLHEKVLKKLEEEKFLKKSPRSCGFVLAKKQAMFKKP